MGKTTVRSHYLPQTYLKHFLLNDELVMYKKGEKFFSEDITPSQRTLSVKGEQALSNIGLENNLYNPGINGLDSNSLEDIFNDYGESTYNELIQSLESLPLECVIPLDIKDKLCIFMAAMRVRTPQFKQEIENMDETFGKHFMSHQFGSMTPEEMVDFNKRELKKDITIDMAKIIIELFSNKNYELKYPNGFFIKMALLMLNHHADIFYQMTMNIFQSNNRYFITSDNPVVFFVPPDKVNFYNAPRSLVSYYSELFFPISKNPGVTFNWRKGEEKITKAGREIVDIFNYNVSHNSFDFIFSPMKMNSLNIFTQKFIPYPFKITVS